ncbi:MAG: autotransporter-associated beta strand repeat-containing protein [Planctomycetia bacterium]|nr:autotransporter-associated beta strand repeat-containing protein [Planctomycetia bacterium]
MKQGIFRSLSGIALLASLVLCQNAGGGEVTQDTTLGGTTLDSESYNNSGTTTYTLTIQPGSWTNKTMSGAITGNLKVVVDYGTGATSSNNARLMLLNTNNSFTGGLEVLSGTVRVADGASLGTGTITLNTGVIMNGYTTTSVAPPATIGNDIVIADGSWGGLRASGALTVNGVISGGGDLVIVGDGNTVTLNAQNTYTGSTSVGVWSGGGTNRGALALGVSDALPSTTVLEIGKSQNTAYARTDATASVTLTAGTTNTVSGLYGIGTLTGSGSLVINPAAGASYDFEGKITGANVTISGTGTQSFSGAINTLQFGNLVVNAGASLNVTNWTAGTTLNVATLSLGGITQYDLSGRSITFTNATMLAGDTTSLTNTATETSVVTVPGIQGVLDTTGLTGNIQLVINSTAGRQTQLAAGQTFTGGIKVVSGIVRPKQLENDTADPSFLGAVPDELKTDAIILDGGTIQTSGVGFTIGATQGITVTENGGSIRMGNNATSDVIIESPITGSGWFGVSGDNASVLWLKNANNDYTGETRIGTSMNAVGDNARLRSDVDGALPTTTNVVFGLTAANLQLGGTTQSIGSLISRTNCNPTETEGEVADMGLITSLATATLTIGNNDASGVYTGYIANVGATSNSIQLTKVGTGTQVLGGSIENTRTDLTVQAGTVELAKTGSAYAVRNLSLTGGSVTLTGDGGNQIDGTVTFSNSATLDLNGKSESVAGIIGAGKIKNDSDTLSVLTVTPSGDVTYSGTTDGNIQFVMAGSGRQRLSGTSTYTGGTVIQRGTLYNDGNTVRIGTGTLEFNATGEWIPIFMANTNLTLGNDILLTTNGSVRVGNATFTLTLTGDISGAGALYLNEGEGQITTFRLEGENTWSGGVVFRGTNGAGNTLVGTSSDAFGTGAIVGNDKPNNIVYDATGDITMVNSLNAASATGSLTVSHQNDGRISFQGNISGAGTVTFDSRLEVVLDIDALSDMGADDVLWGATGTLNMEKLEELTIAVADSELYAGEVFYLTDGSATIGEATMEALDAFLGLITSTDGAGWTFGFDASYGALGAYTLQLGGGGGEVPEPATWGLLLLGMVLGAWGYRNKFRTKIESV